MFTVIIPTLNAAGNLEALLSSVGATPSVVSDGGSTDETLRIAADYKARISAGEPGRGQQLSRGVRWAKETDDPLWYIILHADCCLPEGWQAQALHHAKTYPGKAAYFGFKANAKGVRPRLMEFIVNLRDIWPVFPYGDQGLLISRDMYEAIGGYKQQALFEDVEIIRAIKTHYGRKGLRRMRGRLKSDVSAYARDGYLKRCLRNLRIIHAYNKGVDIETLQARYRKVGSCAEL